MQPDHSFKTFSAHNKHRPIYNPFKELAQPPAGYALLSLLPFYYAVEIGGSPAYEVLRPDELKESPPSDSVGRTRIRRKYETV